MNNSEKIRELRELTQAGMKDCRDSLEEANWELQAAIDIVKKKGLNVVSGREGKVAADGMVSICQSDKQCVLCETNSQTDFVSSNQDFKEFSKKVSEVIFKKASANEMFNIQDVEPWRQELVSKTKENIVVRRWWVEQAFDPSVRIFSYVHSNTKIGVLLTLKAASEAAVNDAKVTELGNDLVMQIAAMNPVAVSSDRLPADVVDRQNAIFEAQLKELNKPQAAIPKILEGKRNKWYTEVCLLEQESVMVPKMTVRQVVKNVGDIEIVNFIRCQVGEGVEVVKENLGEEVAKMTGLNVTLPKIGCFS